MKVYEGTVKLIGNGIWRAQLVYGPATTRSVLEIGDHAFRNIVVSDYLGSYLNSGQYVRILIYKGLVSHYVAAIEVNNKKYKQGKGTEIRRTVVFCFSVLLLTTWLGALSISLWLTIAGLSCAALIISLIKKLTVLANF